MVCDLQRGVFFNESHRPFFGSAFGEILIADMAEHIDKSISDCGDIIKGLGRQQVIPCIWLVFVLSVKYGCKKQDLVKAALQMAADKGWAAVDFIALSAVSGVPLADIFARFDVKDDVLIALGRMVDEQVAEAFGDVRAGEDCRDRLFDVLMERFDVPKYSSYRCAGDFGRV